MEDSLRVKLRVHASVSPSEDRAKVLTAVSNTLGGCVFLVEDGAGDVQLASNDLGCLRKIRDQLRDRHVRDAARRLMLRLCEGNRLNLLLNRQAAFVGVIALCTSQTESPLGAIRVEIDCDTPDKLIDWFTAH